MKQLIQHKSTANSSAENQSSIGELGRVILVKHLKAFVSPVAILAALILGSMCLTPAQLAQIPADGSEWGPCGQAEPGVWQQKNLKTRMTRPCSPSRSTRSPGGTLKESNTDRPGMDYKNFDLAEARPEMCETACESDPKCKAYTYVKPGLQGAHARCWLKSGVPKAVPNKAVSPV